MSRSFFEDFPVFTTREQCVAAADELQRQLASWLPAVRFQEMRDKLERWSSLATQECRDFGAAMAWRRMVFLDDDWFWPELELPASASRVEFQQWALGQLVPLRKLAGQQQLPGHVGAESDRLLTDEPVSWISAHTNVDNQEYILPLRLHPHLRLADAFAITGDRRYLTAMVRHLADMLWVIPGNVMISPDGKNPRTHWGLDALHVGIRAQNLVAMYARTAEALDADATTLMWKMAYLCGARCQEFYHTKPHNIIFYEPAGLGMAGFYFPAFKTAKLWRDSAQQRLIGALRGSIMTDGSNVEAAFGYHAAYLNSPQQVLDAAEFTGIPANPEFVETFRQRRVAMLEFWAKIVTPSRKLPPLGDASAYDVREQLGRLGKLYGSEFSQQVAVSLGGPAEKSFYLPVQRYAVMRSDWSENALWCGFNLRGFYFGHDHYDLFHIQLMAGDKHLLVDTGSIDYDANRECSRASASHNVLAVDSRDNRAGAALDVRWHSNSAFDWCEGLAPGNPNVLHRRAVCFLKPDTFVILDRVEVTDKAEHQYDFFFHLPPGGEARFEFLADDKWMKSQEEGLVTPIAFAKPSKAPVVRFSSKRAGSFSAVTVFFGKAERLPVFVHNAADGEPISEGRAMAVQLGDAHILWSDPGYGEKFTGDWTTDGELLIAQPGKALARTASTVTHREKPISWSAL